MAKTVTDRTPTRSIRLDDQAYEALRAAAANHGSINKLIRAMFVTAPPATSLEIPPEEQIPPTAPWPTAEQARQHQQRGELLPIAMSPRQAAAFKELGYDYGKHRNGTRTVVGDGSGDIHELKVEPVNDL